MSTPGVFMIFASQSRWGLSQCWSATKLVIEDGVPYTLRVDLGRLDAVSGRGGSRDRTPRPGINPSSRPAVNCSAALAERVAERVQ